MNILISFAIFYLFMACIIVMVTSHDQTFRRQFFGDDQQCYHECVDIKITGVKDTKLEEFNDATCNQKGTHTLKVEHFTSLDSCKKKCKNEKLCLGYEHNSVLQKCKLFEGRPSYGHFLLGYTCGVFECEDEQFIDALYDGDDCVDKCYHVRAEKLDEFEKFEDHACHIDDEYILGKFIGDDPKECRKTCKLMNQCVGYEFDPDAHDYERCIFYSMAPEEGVYNEDAECGAYHC